MRLTVGYTFLKVARSKIPCDDFWRLGLKPVKLGLLGVGTVGASTAMVLKNNAAEIARRAGRSIEIIQASRRAVAAGMPAGQR